MKLSNLNIAFLLFDYSEEIDTAGPLEMMSWAVMFEKYANTNKTKITTKEFEKIFATDRLKHLPKNIYTVAYKKTPIKMSSAMTFVPDYTFTTAPKPDILFIPGGYGERLHNKLVKNKTIEYVKNVVKSNKTKFIVTVCTGTFLLAETNILNNKYAITYEYMYPHLKERFPLINILNTQKINANYLVDGNIITSNGPASGQASALKLIELLTNKNYKNLIRSLISYDVPKVEGYEVYNNKLIKTFV